MQAMKTKLTVIVLLTISFQTYTQAQKRTNRSANVDVNNNRTVADCTDIRVTFDRQAAITEQSEISLAASQVSTLRTQMANGGIYITGWDRNEYSVKTCKAARDDGNATSTLRDITTTANGDGQLAVNGPADRDWMANLIIMVPRLSRMDLQTQNGPMVLKDLAGVLRLTATNGPIGLNNVGGVVETNTTNGPISLKGLTGDQRVTAVNGPISIELSGNRWDGPGIQVSTQNGPLSVSIPDGYGSGIVMQTSERAPISCKASVCAGAVRAAGASNLIRIGGGDPVVRLSTANGPLSVQAPKN